MWRRTKRIIIAITTIIGQSRPASAPLLHAMVIWVVEPPSFIGMRWWQHRGLRDSINASLLLDLCGSQDHLLVIEAAPKLFIEFIHLQSSPQAPRLPGSQGSQARRLAQRLMLPQPRSVYLVRVEAEPLERGTSRL